MSLALDYATLFETEIRPRRRRIPKAGVLAVWTGLFLVRPRLAMEIWRERFWTS